MCLGGSVFEVFQCFFGVEVVWEVFWWVDFGDMVFYVFFYQVDLDWLCEQIVDFQLGLGYNVLIVYGDFDMVKVIYGEVGVIVLDVEMIVILDVDYVVFGYLHVFEVIQVNVVYSGLFEWLDFVDSVEKVFVEVDFDGEWFVRIMFVLV